MPGEMIDYGAKALKPVENYIGNYCKLWDNLDDPRVVEAWHAMNTWVTDNIPMAGAAYRQLIVDLYRNNRLMKNELMVRGERVDLGRIRANLLTVIAEGDHITPPCQSEAILAKDREPGQGAVSDSWRSHRDHGRKRGAQDHLAAHRGVAERPLPVSDAELHVDASVDIDLLAGNVVAVANKEGGCLGDFFRLRKAPERDPVPDRNRGYRAGTAASISVAVKPGATTLAVMLYFASSSASTLVKAMMPPLLAA